MKSTWFGSKVLEHGVRPINNAMSTYFNWAIGLTLISRVRYNLHSNAEIEWPVVKEKE